MDKNKYIEDLEKTISKFLKPLNNIPFHIAIKAISGFKVLYFDNNCNKDKELLKRLKEAIANATKNANKKGISASRVNEVGNKIEPFVIDEVNNIKGMKADIPLNSEGKRQIAGYPDIFIKDIDNRITYLECKTYSKKNIDSSFRAFYFQPSKKSKIIHSARHLMVGFEIIKEERNGKQVFVPINWKLYTLEKMLVQVKHEFNASNKVIYNAKALLAEGRVITSDK